MLSHDIADKRFLEIIEKFLKAGIMENGKFLDSERGPRRGTEPVQYWQMSICIMYWITGFDVIVKRQCKGERCLIRYCDDFVCCFQNKNER